jgi:hypothetical protein
MNLLDRIRAWWNKDALERVDEETRMTEHERDVAEEDYEGRKDDSSLRSGRLLGGAGDYERDSEPPRY